jgi:hypothetical protein
MISASDDAVLPPQALEIASEIAVERSSATSAEAEPSAMAVTPSQFPALFSLLSFTKASAEACIEEQIREILRT